jgi:hypothetical protein
MEIMQVEINMELESEVAPENIRLAIQLVLYQGLIKDLADNNIQVKDFQVKVTK